MPPLAFGSLVMVGWLFSGILVALTVGRHFKRQEELYQKIKAISPRFVKLNGS